MFEAAATLDDACKIRIESWLRAIDHAASGCDPGPADHECALNFVHAHILWRRCMLPLSGYSRYTQ